MIVLHRKAGPRTKPRQLSGEIDRARPGWRSNTFRLIFEHQDDERIHAEVPNTIVEMTRDEAEELLELSAKMLGFHVVRKPT